MHIDVDKVLEQAASIREGGWDARLLEMMGYRKLVEDLEIVVRTYRAREMRKETPDDISADLKILMLENEKLREKLKTAVEQLKRSCIGIGECDAYCVGGLHVCACEEVNCEACEDDCPCKNCKAGSGFIWRGEENHDIR